MTLNSLLAAHAVLKFRKVVRHAGLLVAVLLLTPAPASAYRHHLSKRTAHARAFHFIAPFVDLLDIQRTVPTIMVPPRSCHRVSRVTVRCDFHAHLIDGRTIHSYVRVHRQRDGLLGCYTTLDVLHDGI